MATVRTGPYVTMAGWDHAPHLSQEVRDELWDLIPEFEQDARSKGIPSLGSGNVYHTSESTLRVPDFEPPTHWPRIYGLDVGWNCTAAAWLTKNIDEKSPTHRTIYVYHCYKEGKREPSEHAEAIKDVEGGWVPGYIDAAARGRSQKDGQQLIRNYRDQGLQLSATISSVIGGVEKCRLMMNGEAIKVFASCKSFWEEYRKYRRDLNGNIVKKNDHVMDAFRYAILGGLNFLDLLPENPDDEDEHSERHANSVAAYRAGAWMI